jgi:hypothetical protein
MTGLLEGARLKIQRAHEARQGLNAEVRRFLSAQPYEVAVEKDLKIGKGSLHLSVRKPPPPEWGPIIGEIVHDTRSALDHLAYALSILNKGPAPNRPNRQWREIAFPITTSPSAFRSDFGL